MHPLSESAIRSQMHYPSVKLSAVSPWFALFALTMSSPAEVMPNPMFADGAVLQRGRPVPVWGTADDGEKVTVEFAGQTHATTAAADGKWRVDLNPLVAGGPFVMKIAGENVVTLKDLMVGEVWICSGQSNMQFALGGATTGPAAIPKANHPNIRLFNVPRRTSVKPLSGSGGKWTACTPETARHFSAVGYFFGRDLHEALDVPVGLILSSWGGTPAEAWSNIEALEKYPVLRGHVDAAGKNLARYPAAAAAYPAKMEAFEKTLKSWKAAGGPEKLIQFKQWQKQAAQAKRDGRPMPKRPPAAKPQPVAPVLADGPPRTPTVLYNGMIAPVIPYAIKGAIWYQGEGNAKRHVEYRTLFPAMIEGWREQWKQGDFPFLFVQIAPFNNMDPGIREAQMLTLDASANTAMVVTTDVGDATDIHPKRKEVVGQRLALAARGMAYGEKIVSSGPIYQSMVAENGKVTIKFKHVGGGLVAKGGALEGFTIAGADGKFVPAAAEIQGGTVVVSAPGVGEPVAARYGWSGFPKVNLYNKEGLPASPFRTDVE